MEVEESKCIPFLDILVLGNEDGSLGHKIFRKKAHTNNYLHVDSHHHPTQNIGVLKTLFTRALRISDSKHADEEIKYLNKVFTSIGYKNKDIIKTIKRVKDGNEAKPYLTNSQPFRNRYLPYI